MILKILKWTGALGLVGVSLLVPTLAFADTIEFPDNELANESVLPVFDHPESVKSRNVVTAKRIELGVFGAMALTEPIYNQSSFGLMGTYHFNETSGLNLVGSFNSTGLSEQGEQLNRIRDSTTPLNAQYAPSPKYLFLANYQYTAFYGKLSLTKDYVMNLHLFGLAGLGAVGLGDSTRPAGSLGLGQKFYFGPRFAVRFDLRLLMYQGIDVLSRNLSGVATEQSASTFTDKLQLQSLLSIGAVYLLPSF